MSSPLALAAVTAVLRDLLNNGLIDHDITGALGNNVTVTAVPPDTIAIDGNNARTQLNLFLHQVTPNAGWRNVGLPSRDDRGTRLANPPLALDLLYLLTAYGAAELHSEIVLGYAMHLLHETPVLDRQAFCSVFGGGTVDSRILPPAIPALSAADLADQVEQLKLTPETMSTEEMSKLWSAVQAQYRPTAAYHLSVVLIEARRATRNALPVLTRGPRDLVTGDERGVVAVGGLIPPYPLLTCITLDHGQIAAQQGDVVSLNGHNLEGSNVRVRFAHPRLVAPIEINLGNNANEQHIDVTLPNDAAAHLAWPPGLWNVTVVLRRAGETVDRSTNSLPLLLAPRLDIGASAAARNAVTGGVTINLAFTPHVRPGQTVSLNVGGREVPGGITAQTGTLQFVFPSLAAGPQWLRLRVDGADSLLIDRAATPPQFDPTQQMNIPAWPRRVLERIARDDGNGEEEVEPAPAATPTLNFLCTQFGLSEFERHVVLLCAGVELEPYLAHLCASAQTDPRCDYPSFGLALAVLPGAHWSALSPQAPLRHWHLVDLGDTHHLTSARLMLDERILHFLLGVGALDTRLAALARPLVTDIALSPTQQREAERLERVWTQTQGELPVLRLQGDDHTAARAMALRTCEACGLRPLILRADELPHAAVERNLLARLLTRECMLGGTASVIEAAGDDAGVGYLLDQLAGPIILLGPPPATRHRCITRTIAKPRSAERRELWRAALPEHVLEEGELAQLAAHFEFSAADIQSVAATAHMEAALHESTNKTVWRGGRRAARRAAGPPPPPRSARSRGASPRAARGLGRSRAAAGPARDPARHRAPGAPSRDGLRAMGLRREGRARPRHQRAVRGRERHGQDPRGRGHRRRPRARSLSHRTC